MAEFESEDDSVAYEYSEDEEDDVMDEDARPSLGSPGGRERAGSSMGRDRANSQRMADGATALLGADDVHEMMAQKAAEAAELLDLDPAHAEVLLRHAGWSSERLMEGFWGDADALRAKAGMRFWADAQPPPAGDEVCCEICYGDYPAAEMKHAPCGHAFCGECYRAYARQAVDDGPSSVDARCPSAGCDTSLPPALVDDLLDEERARRLRRFRIEAYVRDTRELRWCPGAGCDRVARAGQGVSTVKCAPGGCGAAFCMRCGEEAHAPTSCALLTRWLEKCQNESETANWILANTKRCPKCQTRIEKNQGCNHMQCFQCKYDFCWMCLGEWSTHGATTGGYYKCNKYDPTKDAEDGDNDAARAKRELDRYLHYYKRFHGHDQAQKFASKQLEATERRMVELQEQSKGASWIDVQFLKSANEMVVDCRRVLKATYIFSYYLDPDRKLERELFENLQEHLEKFTETLSEMTELPVDQMDRTEIVNMTRVTESFLVNLIKGTEAGLVADAEEA